MNGCIYQEADNPSSYACFVHAFNEVGCSVDVDQSSKYLVLLKIVPIYKKHMLDKKKLKVVIDPPLSNK